MPETRRSGFWHGQAAPNEIVVHWLLLGHPGDSEIIPRARRQSQCRTGTLSSRRRRVSRKRAIVCFTEERAFGQQILMVLFAPPAATTMRFPQRRLGNDALLLCAPSPNRCLVPTLFRTPLCPCPPTHSPPRPLSKPPPYNLACV